MRYLIDCDPGADDVMALMIGLKKLDQEIKGIITVSGNVVIETVTKNACAVVELANKEIPVCQGSCSPLIKAPFMASEVHGESGMGPFKLDSGSRHLVHQNFIDFYMEKIMESEEKTTIVALGPMTNIAILIKSHSEVASKISRVIFMGGSYNDGNVTPYAEFNAFVDPEAYKILFDSEVELVMVGLDATHMTLIKIEEIEEGIKGISKASLFMKNLLTWYAQNVMEVYGYLGAHMHDPSAIMYILYPEIFKTFKANLEISTNDDVTRGKIMINHQNPRKNVTVVSSIDNELFKQRFFEVIDQYNS